MVCVALAGALAMALWLGSSGARGIEERLPGQTVRPPTVAHPPTIAERPSNPGTLIQGTGQPSALAGSWPGFRGPDRDGIAPDAQGLLRAWPVEGPRALWRTPVGEGYAGAAIHRGRVYLIDYDQQRQEDAIRCLSLEDGAEIWRYTYSVRVKRFHGMSRTVPAVNDQYVVAIGPKCHVTCLNAVSGDLVWKMDLVAQFKTVVPPWYAGQCALIDDDVAVLAPGGEPLMMAVELATGTIRWRTPNPGGHGMTHSSIMPAGQAAGRQYVYCTTEGVVGVAAADGRLLWTYPGWKISIANVPSPVPIDGERIFLSGGYNSGCALLRLAGGFRARPPEKVPGTFSGAKAGPTEEATARKGTRYLFSVEEVFRLKPDAFGSDQQTPIYYEGCIYGVLPNGQLGCLDLEGRQLWTSGAQRRFGLGPYLLADGMLYVLNDQTGTLYLVSAEPGGYNELASGKVLTGHEAWAPMALAAGRLILRDLTEMVCVEVGGPPP